MSNKKQTNEILNAFLEHKKTFGAIVVFSALINLVYLAPSLYMLSIYDRVITSRSESTLLFLSLIALAAFIFLSLMDFIRGQILIAVNGRLDEKLSKRIFTATFQNNLMAGVANPSSVFNDLTSIRQFSTGAGLMAFLDMPWTPIYLAFIYWMHPLLGAFATFGMLLLFGLTLLNEKLSKGPLAEANKSGALANNFVNSNLRNADVIAAMGMLNPIIDKWYQHQTKTLDMQALASKRASQITSTIKFCRLLIQSGSLAIGAILVIEAKASPAIMFAANILLSRALSPVETLIGNWRNFDSARAAYFRLVELLDRFPVTDRKMKLPQPTGLLEIQSLFGGPPNIKKPIIKGVTSQVGPGDLVTIVGPSAAGKSTFLKLLSGIWLPQNGSVKLDGANLQQWNPDELGNYVGYLPQDIELFRGTIAENISRFQLDDEGRVIAAAKLAGIHEMILSLEAGYNTEIGESGGYLSGGQRQRIGLARALYGEPSIIFLDEPNSNLDELGERALVQALLGLKAKKTTVILVTHKVNILNIADRIMVLKDGVLVADGARDQILPNLLGNGKQSN